MYNFVIIYFLSMGNLLKGLSFLSLFMKGIILIATQIAALKVSHISQLCGVLNQQFISHDRISSSYHRPEAVSHMV